MRAEMPGYAAATLPSFNLAIGETKTVDIVLLPSPNSAQQSSAARPEFFDEPRFTVAGVTDTTSLGGHGSDAVVRNREALASAAASLAKNSPAASAPSPDPALEKSLREAVARQPDDFDANHRLGKLLLNNGKPSDALAYLDHASQLRPQDPETRYELGLARADTGDFERARADALALLSFSNLSKPRQAEAHHLLGILSEKTHDPLQAVQEFQRATELDPTETNFFDWGTELLLHHAAAPAVEVFTQGNRLLPASARILAGLGSSWYALGSYDNAAQRFCEASDLDPADPDPYLLMGKMQAAEPAPFEAINRRLQRFVALHPENALANYYYAVSLWKRRKSSTDNSNFFQIKSLLQKAVQIDPALGLAYLQLGIIDSEQQDMPSAIADYERAITASPDLEEAHYRLAQAYRQAGQISKEQAELQTYKKLSDAKAAEIARQRHEVQQFVIQLHPATEPKPH